MESADKNIFRNTLRVAHYTVYLEAIQFFKELNIFLVKVVYSAAHFLQLHYRSRLHRYDEQMFARYNMIALERHK